MKKQNEVEQAKEELIKKLKDGNLDGIEKILNKVNPGKALYLSFLKDMNPKIINEFYTKIIDFYSNKQGYSHIVSLAQSFQERLRRKYSLELEEKWKHSQSTKMTSILLARKN